MKDHPLRLFIDRIRAQEREHVDVTLDPDFMDIHEDELVFSDLVKVEGDVYLAGEEVVISLHAQTVMRMPCSICNAPVAQSLECGWTTVEPVTSFRHGVVDLREMVRENLLLEVPLIIECEAGKCPTRAEIATYLRQKQQGEDETGYHPFAGLQNPDE